MPVEFKDYYQVLGVASDATEDQIKKAFRTLARKFHPDVAKDKRTAEESFKEVNEAHQVLSDPVSRQKYDELGADWKSGPRPTPSPGRTGNPMPDQEAGNGGSEFRFEGTGFSDFFEQFFGGGRGGPRGTAAFHTGAESGGRNRSASASDADPAEAIRGRDIQGDILISLEEVLTGAMRAISVSRTDPRSGRETTQTYQVRIPAGMQAGRSIRVPGKGGEGHAGGQAGDIYLRVHHAQHPDWQTRGADLVGQLDLAPWEAVLGGTVRVRTLEGGISIKVPPGTQQGHQLRVRGKGLPTTSGKRGDLYVAVSIQVPAKVSASEERLWQELAKESKFEPRKPPKTHRSAAAGATGT